MSSRFPALFWCTHASQSQLPASRTVFTTSNIQGVSIRRDPMNQVLIVALTVTCPCLIFLSWLSRAKVVPLVRIRPQAMLDLVVQNARCCLYTDGIVSRLVDCLRPSLIVYIRR
jgi:hypothetical protein